MKSWRNRYEQKASKEKRIYESECEKIWGYVMPYSELRKMERSYHKTVVVQQNYRNITDYSDLEELSSLWGIPYEIPEKNYHYPNRLRFHTIRKVEGKGFHRVLK